VLISSNTADERLTTAHRAKLAYVYVRQSSVNQVRQHQESTELQYRLVDRAIGLGWPPERVQVIDEDLGNPVLAAWIVMVSRSSLPRSALATPVWW
jgi:hypothetical protein